MQFIIMLILLIIMDFLRPVPAPPRRPGLDEFQTTTADQSRRIPVFWGDCWLKGPNLVWYGDLRIEKVKEKVKGIFKSKTYTAGYKYHLGFHLVFGHSTGDAVLLELKVTKDTIWSGAVSGGTFSIEKGNLWGGDKEGGGISGPCTWLSGGSTQGQDSYLRGQLGSRVPAYRGVCSLVGRQVYIGTSTVLRQWYARVRRLPTALGSGHHDINGEANPMEMLYELLTVKTWGLGLLPSEIDVSGFRSNAATLASEGMGMSLSWDGPKTVEDMIKEIDRHIDSITFQDPISGVWRCVLIRDNYDVENLLEVNETNAELVSFMRPTADELVNELKVVYSSAEFDGDPVPLQVQDTAGYWNRDNQKVSSEVSYPGFTQKKLAAKVAQRDLRTLGYPFARLQLKLNRRFWSVRQGTRLRFSWASSDLNITNMPIIVLERDMGTLADGQIQIVAMQDVFGVGQALYEDTDTGSWTKPDTSAKNPTNMRMEFTPYWFMYLDDEVASPLSAVPMLMVESPSALHYGYTVDYADPAIGTTLVSYPVMQYFTPTGVLQHDYLESPGLDTSGALIVGDLNGMNSIEPATLSEIREIGEGFIVIDSEWMAVEEAVQLSDGTWKLTRVHRGLLDSVITRHLAGAKVWFVSAGAGRTPTELNPMVSGTYKARVISQARGGVADRATAPVLTLSTNAGTTNARPLYDYPPRDVTINGSRVPTKLTGSTISVAWKMANKVAETALKLAGDEASAAPSGAYTVVTLHNDLGTQLASSGPVFTSSYNFSVGDLVGGLPASGFVKLVTVNNKGTSAAVTLWFGRGVDYASQQDQAPQRFLDEASPWTFHRMND